MAALTQSYVHGASSTPLLGETIGALLRRVVAEGPQRPALVARHQNVRWTYADLLRRSEDLAVGLQALGLKKGDRIGIWSANNSEWVLAQFGTALAGLILVNINPAYRSHEFDYAIKKVRLPGADPEPGPQEQRLFRLAAFDRARDRRAAPGKLASKGAAESRDRDPARAEKTPGMLNFDDVARPRREEERRGARRLRRRRCSSTIRSTSSSPPARPARRRARR